MGERWIMKRLMRVLVAVGVVLVAIQFVPVERDNPPEEGPITGPPEVVEVLARSCFDCHSNRTRWPWYSRVAPVSWLVASDVHEGRSRLNFSNWEKYDAARREDMGREIRQEVERGEMPLGIYLVMHDGARLDPQSMDTIRAWSQGLKATSSQQPSD
jgi:hypothetical protein